MNNAAHSHQSGPARSVSHNSVTINGTPISTESAAALTRSKSHVRKVVLLNPNFASISKVLYKSSGVDATAPMKPKSIRNAAPLRYSFFTCVWTKPLSHGSSPEKRKTSLSTRSEERRVGKEC